MVIAENSAFTMLSFWNLHDKHLFLCPMKRRRYIAWVLMLVSIIMLTASVLPHHHHREILCLQHDMTLCGCQCSVQHQQHNNSSDENHTCNAGCVTKFKSVTPDRAQDSVSPDYSFCLLLYTVTDVLALSFPSTPRKGVACSSLRCSCLTDRKFIFLSATLLHFLYTNFAFNKK